MAKQKNLNLTNPKQTDICVYVYIIVRFFREMKYNIPHLLEGPRINFEREKPEGAGLIRIFVSFAFRTSRLFEHRGPWKNWIASS